MKSSTLVWLHTKRMLGKLTVDNAVAAVNRAEMLAKRAEKHSFRRAQHRGYSYYLDNPATDLWVPVKQMLEESGLIDPRDGNTKR